MSNPAPLKGRGRHEMNKIDKNLPTILLQSVKRR